MTCDMLISPFIQLSQQRTLMKLMQPPTFHHGQGRKQQLNNQNWITRTEQPEPIIGNEKPNTFDDESNDEDNENDDSNQQNIPDQTDDENYNGFITQYDNNDHQQTLTIPLGTLKKDEPFPTTKIHLNRDRWYAK